MFKGESYVKQKIIYVDNTKYRIKSTIISNHDKKLF